MIEREQSQFRPVASKVNGQTFAGTLQRKCGCGNHAIGGQCDSCKGKSGTLQRNASTAVEVSAAPSIASGERFQGQLLDESTRTRAFSQPRYGGDFSQVRAMPNFGRAAKNAKNGAAAQAAPTAAAPDKELSSSLFFGNADLKEVLNRRKLLKSGSTGDAVRLVQEALLAEGYELPKFGADGKFGSETAKAVREFQRRWRMAVDGIVGDKTLGLLDLHLVAKGVLAVGESIPVIGGLVKGLAAAALDEAEKQHRKTACPAADKAERLTACIQPVVIANDDGSTPTAAPSFNLSQRIWEKCCVNLSVLGTQTVKSTAFKTLDESPTNVPTAEETALFTAAGASTCIQVFIPENFEQAGVIGKQISGGGATYDGGAANAKVVVVEGAVPAVVAHEIGHALGHGTHDNAETVMKPTGAHNVPNSSKVSTAVCAASRTGAALSKTSGKDDCCMFPR